MISRKNIFEIIFGKTKRVRIFWEVNTGRACDFLPWLLQAPWQHKSDVKRWTASIRQYVVTNLVQQQAGGEDNLVGALLKKVNADQDSQVYSYNLHIVSKLRSSRNGVTGPQ